MSFIYLLCPKQAGATISSRQLKDPKGTVFLSIKKKKKKKKAWLKITTTEPKLIRAETC